MRRLIRKWRNRRAHYKLAKAYIYVFPRDPGALDVLIHALDVLNQEYDTL